MTAFQELGLACAATANEAANDGTGGAEVTP